MRMVTIWLAVLFLSIGSAVASAADFARGLDALDRGDYPEALQELKPLAETGHARAEFRLGTMYALGVGVARDYKQAATWLAKAAAQGNARAQNDLGTLYDQGRGVQADPQEAVRLFRKAAEQGNAAAQLNLAYAYQQGRGVPADPMEAFAWASTAVELGELRAGKLLDAVVHDMTPDEVNRAQLRAAQYRQKYAVPFRTY